MSTRPRVVTSPEQSGPRPSRKVKTVARLLETDESTVRDLLKAGKLEGHGLGTRGVRVFLDSVEDYQHRRTLAPERETPAQETVRKRRQASTAAHRAAIADLMADGLL